MQNAAVNIIYRYSYCIYRDIIYINYTVYYLVCQLQSVISKQSTVIFRTSCCQKWRSVVWSPVEEKETVWQYYFVTIYHFVWSPVQCREGGESVNV